GAALFETGRVFRSGGDAAPLDERDHVAAALSGTASHGYPEPPRQFGFLDAKGALEALMETLGIGRWSLGDPPGHPFHPARSATVVVVGRPVRAVGEVHPGVADRLDVAREPQVAVLDRTATAQDADER